MRIKNSKHLEPSTDNYLLLSGILNASLAEHYIRASVSTHFRGGFASYNRQFIDGLPIKIPKTEAEKKLAKRITETVKTIMDAKKTAHETMSDGDRARLESKIEAYEKRADQAVFELYGVQSFPDA